MASRMFVRRATMLAKGEAGVVPNTPRYKRIQDLQNTFCRDDGLLVWQKLGRDKMGYYVTMALTVVGFGPALAIIYGMSFPSVAPKE